MGRSHAPVLEAIRTLDVRPLQRRVRLEVFRLSSLFPTISTRTSLIPQRSHGGGRERERATHLATVRRSFLYTQGAIPGSAVAFSAYGQLRHWYRRILELLSDCR